MKTTTTTLRFLLASRALHACGALLLAGVWITFCYSHLLAWQHTGAWSYLLFAPASNGILPGGAALIAAGVLLQIGGLLSLNRSFGLVAARRTVKTGGLYRLVRHPLYASYLLMYLGYVLVNTSLANVLLVLLGVLLLMARIVREERFLARDVQYMNYMDQVKYRLIPLLF